MLSTIQYSVVVPVYNNQAELLRAVNSAIAQTTPPREIIICNDASGDPSTLDLLALLCSQYPNMVKVVSSSINQGAAATRNKGIFAASAPIIAFLDADDEWLPGKMAEQLKVFLFPEIIGCGCCTESRPPRFLDGRFLSTLSMRDLLYRNIIQPSTFVVRKQALLDVSGFNSTHRYAEEGDLYLRLITRGSLVFINKQLVRYNIRSLCDGSSKDSGRLSNKTMKMYLGNIRNLYLAYGRRDIPFLQFLWHSGLIIARLLRSLLLRKARLLHR